MDEEREVRGQRRLLVFDGGMPLCALLVERLVAREWPGAQVRSVAEPRGSGTITVEDLQSGRTLKVCVTAPTQKDVSDAVSDETCSMVSFRAPARELAAGLAGLGGGRSYVSSSLSGATSDSPAFSALTARETEVASLIAEGLTTGEIAKRLVLAPGTVRSHLRSARVRLGVPSRGTLASKWRMLHR
jgi:DNA-binding NarL/FixJ family response regulator